MIKELEQENFEEEVKEGFVLVDFYAVWCGPCKMMHPVLEEFVSENPNIKVIKVNVDHYENVARNYGIMSIPTLILFKDGKIQGKSIGFTSKEILTSWIQEL